MERYWLPALTLPPLVHEALTVVGAGIVLLLGFVLINFGLLLPGLFAWLEKRLGGQQGTEGKQIAQVTTSIAGAMRSRSRSFMGQAETPHVAADKDLPWVLRTRDGRRKALAPAAGTPPTPS